MKKLTLQELKVSSFITNEETSLNKNTIHGGKYNTVNTCVTVEYIICIAEPVSNVAQCFRD